MSRAGGSGAREEDIEDGEIESQPEELARTKRRDRSSLSRSKYDADSSSSDSYVDERRERYTHAREPPCKRSRLVSDYRFEQMQNQIQFLSDIILSQKAQPSPPEKVIEIHEKDVRPQSFLAKPREYKTIDLGTPKTNVDEKRVIRSADKELLETLNGLQRFNSADWKEVRFASALRNFLATPGFTDLKVNEELCYLENKKDPIAHVERVLAGLSNAVLAQRNLLKCSLQSIIDWAFSKTDNFSPNTLFEKLSSNFGTGSQISKNFEDMLQIICGKRAECIENRREALLSELKNKNAQAALHKIPPSADYLFSKEQLAPLIQSLGGSQVWLNTPSYAYAKKSLQKGHPQPSCSSQSFRFSKAQPDKGGQKSRFSSFKPRAANKKEIPRVKSEDSFRRKQEK